MSESSGHKPKKTRRQPGLARQSSTAARRSRADVTSNTKGTRGICGAVRRKDGQLCVRQPGAGTDHPGVGRCFQHGGKSPAGIKSAATIIGHGMILDGHPVMGKAIDMAPSEALLKCVAVAAGEMAYCSLIVERLSTDQTFEETQNGRDLNFWIRERQRTIDRLARLAKMALDAGVAERQVAIAERMADMMTVFARGMMEDLNLTASQRAAAPKIVERRLLELTSQSGQGTNGGG